MRKSAACWRVEGGHFLVCFGPVMPNLEYSGSEIGLVGCRGSSFSAYIGLNLKVLGVDAGTVRE